MRRILFPVGPHVSHGFLGLGTQQFQSRTGDNADLGNALGVTQDDTNLRRRGTLLGQLADLVDDLVGVGLEPRGSGARVRDRGRADALALGVKSAHLVGRLGELAIVVVGGCCSVSEGRKKFVSREAWVKRSRERGLLVGGEFSLN